MAVAVPQPAVMMGEGRLYQFGTVYHYFDSLGYTRMMRLLAHIPASIYVCWGWHLCISMHDVVVCFAPGPHSYNVARQVRRLREVEGARSIGAVSRVGR